MPSASKKRKPSKRESEAVRALRYMVPENIAKDFRDKRSRAAIAAVFDWFDLNSTVAWRLKNGTYTNRGNLKSRLRDIETTDAIILEEETYERARKLLTKGGS